MRIKGISANDLRKMVLQVSSFLYDQNLIFNREPETIGNYVHFTLRVKDSRGKGARRSASGKRTVWACWHAHRDVMRMIFETNPESILVSALARYEGREGFYRSLSCYWSYQCRIKLFPYSSQRLLSV